MDFQWLILWLFDCVEGGEEHVAKMSAMTGMSVGCVDLMIIRGVIVLLLLLLHGEDWWSACFGLLLLLLLGNALDSVGWNVVVQA